MKLSKIMTASTLAGAMMLGSVTANAGNVSTCQYKADRLLNQVKQQVADTSRGYGLSGFIHCRIDVGAKRLNLQHGGTTCKQRMRWGFWRTSWDQQQVINRFRSDAISECNKLRG